MPTGRDVAILAGVSQATVSRVFRGDSRVVPETRARVIEAATTLRYVPNAQARAMRNRVSGIIGVVTGRVRTPFYPEDFVDAIGSSMVKHGVRMLLWNLEQDDDETPAFEMMRSGLLDGLIFTSADLLGNRTLALAEELGMPYVLVNRKAEGLRSDTVVSDNLAGGRAVARYFIRNGRTRAAIVGSTSGQSNVRDRRLGFLQEFAEQGIPIRSDWLTGGDVPYTHDIAFSKGRALLETDDFPDAVFCTGRLNTFGVLDAARRVGRKVPDDTWVVGYDDTEMCSWESYDATMMRQPVELMANAAVTALIRRIAEPHSHFVHEVLPASLIVRGSTNNTAVAPG
jgi:LacI family transcriptional regulator